MQRKVVPDHLAVLHHEPNALQLAYVGERIGTHFDDLVLLNKHGGRREYLASPRIE